MKGAQTNVSTIAHSSLTETNVGMLLTGLNGDFFVHYDSEHIKCDMTSQNGEEEGETITLRYSVPSFQSENRNGVRSYYVEGLNEWERLLLIMSKGIDPSVVINSMEGVLSYDIESGSIRGLVRFKEEYYAIDCFKDTSRVIMADMDIKKLVVYVNGKRIDTHYTMGVIDLDTSGRRWEGGVSNRKPFGYGVLYDEEGRREYEGFIMNGMKTCYGMEYYRDIERVKYGGCFYNNYRFGKGTLYDRNGANECGSLWKNNKPYSPQFDGHTVDNLTESIEIPNHSFNKPSSFILRSFIHSLKRIMIRYECFESVRLFELDGLSELKSVEIGKKSFTCIKNGDSTWYDMIRDDSSCRIMNCPKLKSIRIGGSSFCNYHSFELSNLPSLRTIDIGVQCFYYTPVFSLTGLID